MQGLKSATRPGPSERQSKQYDDRGRRHGPLATVFRLDQPQPNLWLESPHHGSPGQPPASSPGRQEVNRGGWRSYRLHSQATTASDHVFDRPSIASDSRRSFHLVVQPSGFPTHATRNKVHRGPLLHSILKLHTPNLSATLFLHPPHSSLPPPTFLSLCLSLPRHRESRHWDITSQSHYLTSWKLLLDRFHRPRFTRGAIHRHTILPFHAFDHIHATFAHRSRLLTPHPHTPGVSISDCFRVSSHPSVQALTSA